MKKAKKFAAGGFNDQKALYEASLQGIGPTDGGFPSLPGNGAIGAFPVRGGGGGGGAFGGLETVGKGSSQIGESLQGIQQNLGGPGGGGGLPRQMPMFKKGGSVGSASKRADGCATKGKTKGRMV